jgi:predicted transposase YbfD/YdcC
MTVARAMLARLPVAGRVVTADAWPCQRDTCQRMLAAGGDGFVLVEANQPTLLADITALFDDPPPGERVAFVEQRGRHGDRREVRRRWAATALVGYLDWPGVGQVGKVERVVKHRGVVTRQVRSVLTSLGAVVGPARLLALKRGQWQIEHGLHDGRDGSLGEDASHVRTGAAPPVVAASRNVVLNLLRHAKVTAIKATIRQLGWERSALRLLGWVPS